MQYVEVISVSTVREGPNYNFHITSKGNQTFSLNILIKCTLMVSILRGFSNKINIEAVLYRIIELSFLSLVFPTSSLVNCLFNFSYVLGMSHQNKPKWWRQSMHLFQGPLPVARAAHLRSNH